MIFASPDFLFFFLPLALAFCYAVRCLYPEGTPWAVLGFSLVFYGWWRIADLYVLVLSVVTNFFFLSLIHALHRRDGKVGGVWIVLSTAVTANLALLAYFKYADFTLSTIGVRSVATDPRAALPLGISFFTFTQIAFLVDAARRTAPLCPFVHYGLFVAYFPHLIAGPIYHHREMIGQFAGRVFCRPTAAYGAAGMTVLTIGLLKKIVLADSLSQYGAPVFDAAARGQVTALLESWGGALAYSLQLYFDFSGYMDIAAGVSIMMGVRLPINFNSPYKAVNITEFWRRWHMTLSRFFRDYLYVPLGGSRRGMMRRLGNVWITMLLCGLWHGAGWTFIVWGAIHGLYLALHVLWRALRERMTLFIPRVTGYEPHLRRALSTLLTFGAVTVAWVVFRAESLPAAGIIVNGMAGLNGIHLPASWLPTLGLLGEMLVGAGVVFKTNFDGLWGGAPQLLWIVVGLAVVWWGPNTQNIMARYGVYLSTGQRCRPANGEPWWRWRPSGAMAVTAGFAALAALTIMVIRRETPAFLYFQF